MKIRQATIKDIPAVLDMWSLMHAESDFYKNIPISNKKTLRTALGYHLSKSRIILIAESEGDPSGMMFGKLDSYMFSDEQFVTEALLYVKPEHRKGFVAYRLVKEFELWGDRLGVTKAKAGISTGTDTEKHTNFYGRLGYIPTGATLSKELCHG